MGQAIDIQSLGIPVLRPASTATKALQAIGIVLFFIMVCFVAFRGAEWWLTALFACLLVVRVVVVEWFDDEGDRPSLKSVLVAPILTLTGGVIVFLALNLSSLAHGKFDSEGLITVAKFVLALLSAYEVSILYRWRRASRARRVAESEGVAEETDRISVPGALYHFAGYIVGFAAAVTAVSFATDWLDRGLAYVVSFLIGKLLVDMFSPTYRSLARAPLSQSLLRMAAISPLWWGLPWAIVAGVGSTLAINSSTNLVLLFLPEVVLESVAPLIVVVTSGFCLMALAGVLIDVLSGSRFGYAPPGTGLSASDWLRLFLGVLILNFVSLLALYRPTPLWGRDLYGEERWTCAESRGEYMVGWVPAAGVHITVHDNYIALFNLSCVPRANGRGCDYDDSGWDRLVFEFRREGGGKILSYSRGQDDVRSEYRHHADLVFGASVDVVNEMLRSKNVSLTISAPNGRELYSINADLASFAREYGKCNARWRDEAGGAN